MKKLLASLCAVLMCSAPGMAYDIMVDDIAYNYNADSSALAVTYTTLDADNYSALTEAVIPAVVNVNGEDLDVTAIDDFAFIYSSKLTAITLPHSISQIGDRAFAYCPELQSITIDGENGVYYSPEESNVIIDDRTGTLVAASNAAVIPDYIDEIGPFAFAGCTGLTEVDIPSTITKIGYAAFDGCGLKSVYIPESVSEIGYRAFAHCDSLISITVDAGNDKYDSRGNCNAVIEKASGAVVATCGATTFPADVATIGYEAFAGCTALQKIVIPESVSKINHYAFAGCSSLVTADIPASVTFFGDRAFEDCASLEKVYARLVQPQDAEYGNLLTFAGVPVDTCLLLVPDELIDLYKATKPWSDFMYIKGINEQDVIPGDVNLDGVIDVDDVNILIAIILGKDKAENYDGRAYITDDDVIDVDDVNALIQIILEK